jgi:hypothetical protein
MFVLRSYGFFLLTLMLAMPFGVFGQDDDELEMPKAPKGSVAEKIQDRSFDDTEILRKQEFTGGIMIHSQGFGAILRRSKNKTFRRKRVIELEAVSMEHPKELRSVNPYYENTRSYNYGELNQVVVTRLGYGRHNVIYAKFDKGVEIRYLYIGGLSVAWAKPIYLEIGYPAIPYEYVATERYDPERHFVDNIYGRASDLTGIDKMRLYPGMYGRFGFSFDYAKRQKNISSIETGVIIDYYVQDVPMMARIKNDPYYLTFYVSLQFGTRWYRKFANRKDQ